MDNRLWQQICDEEALPADSWIREGPRPDGPLEDHCLCNWCNATRRYLERLSHSAPEQR